MPNLFIININYTAPLEEIDRYMKEHIDFLKICYDKDVFIVSGRKEPRKGGIILAQGLSKEQLGSLMQSDPFIKYKLAEFEIIEFSASQSIKGFKSFLKH